MDQMPEEKYPALKKYTRDLTELARAQKLDPIIGRDKDHVNKQILETPIGSLLILSSLSQGIIKIDFERGSCRRQGTLPHFQWGQPPCRRHPLQMTIFVDLCRQLTEYFSGRRKKFNLSFTAEGTAFDQAVWQETSKIPYGEVRTYKEIAARLGKPNAARAVGRALKRNPIPIIIPCHRVVSSNGIGGYTPGLRHKLKLLKLENPSDGFQIKNRANCF